MVRQVPGHEVTELIKFVDITKMEKASSMGGMLQNAIEIDVSEASPNGESRNLFFASFMRRNYAFTVMRLVIPSPPSSLLPSCI